MGKRPIASEVISNQNNTLNNIKSNLLLRAGLGLTVANIATGVLGYAYQILMGRMLDPSEFALFGAITALLMIFSAPLGAMFLLVSRRVSILNSYAESSGLLRMLYFRGHKFVIISGIIFLVLFFYYVDVLQDFLQSADQVPLWVFAGAMIASALIVINNAFFQGRKMFRLLGTSGVVAILVKVLTSYFLVSFGFGVSGALSGLIFSTVIIWIIGVVIMLRILPSREQLSTIEVEPFPINTIIPVIVANIAFTLMTQLDMIFVKHYFSATEAGLYAAVSVLGKAILYLPGGLVLAMFPIAAENSATGKSSSQVLMQALALTALFCTGMAVLYWFFGDWLILQFYGTKYVEAGELLRWYGFAILPMAFVMVAEYFLIAQGRVIFAWLFMGIAPLQILAITIHHEELWMIMAILGIFGGLLCFIGFSFLLKSYLTVERPSTTVGRLGL